MSTTKKLIIGAVTFIAAIGFCILTLTLYNKGETSINSTVAQYDEVVDDYSNIKLAMYDNSIVSGTQIIELINDLDENSGYTIVVKNGVNQNTAATAQQQEYKYSTSTDFKDKVDSITNKSATEFYINPNASFKSTVSKDSNGAINVVTFVQQGVK